MTLIINEQKLNPSHPASREMLLLIFFESIFISKNYNKTGWCFQANLLKIKPLHSGINAEVLPVRALS
jgi:hypothetical protein